MQVDPKDEWKIMLKLGIPLLIIMLLYASIVTVPILSIFYHPLVPLVAFFLAILVIHIFLMPWIHKTKLKSFGIILLYTIAVDGTILLISKQFTLFLLFPPMIIAFLLGINRLFEHLMTYHARRNVLSKFDIEDFSKELQSISLEIDYRNVYNVVVAFAFSIVGIFAFFCKWNSKTTMTHFAEYSVLAIIIVCFYNIIKDSLKIAKIFDSDVFHSHVFLAGHSYKTPYWELSGAIDKQMKNIKDETPDKKIDYFDRAGEIRKFRYYSSLSLLFLLGVYLCIYTMLPTSLITLDFKWVIVACVVIGLLTIQLPYFIGQKKLAMSLTAEYSGTEHRKMLDLLGTKSPAWNFLHTSEVIGVGTIPAIVFWLLDFSLKNLMQ